jgi:hypothetical protein
MTKCNCCNKKISLSEEIISKCSCEKLHCLLHRLPELHDCKAILEIKQKSRNKLEKSLVRVDAEKIIKI